MKELGLDVWNPEDNVRFARIGSLHCRQWIEIGHARAHAARDVRDAVGLVYNRTGIVVERVRHHASVFAAERVP